MLGRTEEIMISGNKDGYSFWRTRNFKEVYIKDELINHKPGDLVMVKITELDRYVLKWELEK
jgi:tRNA A37 methylthiotransferase MiaB